MIRENRLNLGFVKVLFVFIVLFQLSSGAVEKRAAGLLIFRRVESGIEYLLMKSSKDLNNWTPPKGHAEPGEDDFTTALRETQEEAGFVESDLNIFKDQHETLNYQVKGKDKTVVYWLAELRDPHKAPVLSHEQTEFRWLNKDDTISLAGYENFAEMVRHFHSIIKSL